MSHSFYLDVQSLSVDNVLAATGLTDIRFVEGYRLPPNDNWPAGSTCIYRDGVSARPLEIEYDNETVRIRIFAASSPDDYRFALELTCAISRIYGADITPEDNETMSLDTFRDTYDAQWLNRHCAQNMAIVLGHKRRSAGKPLEIPGVHRTLILGDRVAAQLAGCPNAAVEFFDRLRKLNYIDSDDVFQSPIKTVKSESGDEHVRLAGYPEGTPTLLHDVNTIVVLSNKQANQDNETIHVPLNRLPALIGGEAVWLSEDRLLVPALKGRAWQAFIERALTVAVTDVFEYGYSPADDAFGGRNKGATNPRLTGEDLNTLAYAPVAVFCLVAGADGDIDRKEIKAFQSELVKGVLLDSHLLEHVMTNAAAQFEAIFTDLMSNGVNVQEKFVEIVDILDNRLSSNESLRFKSSLVELGRSIAEASGGVLGFGNRISPEEKRALAMLTVWLDLIDQPVH